MRVSKEKAAENRERILREASRLMRERGISGAGVDALTEAAGMTHGSLYSQFCSKEHLIEQALDYMTAGAAQRTDGATTIAEYVANYLNASHRDSPGNGCPIAALCSEIPRQGAGTRTRYTDGLRVMVKQLSSRLSPELKPKQRDEAALAIVASLVGALVLSRAVNDPKLSDDVLQATKRHLSR